MFEEIISLTKKSALDNIKFSGEYIYLPEILSNTKLHPSIAVFLSAEAGWWIYNEQLLRVSNSNFNFKKQEINFYFGKIDELMIENARFTQNELEKLIDFAVKVRLNIIVRPRNALKWFVFQGGAQKSFYEIQKRLDYIYDYRYLLDGFYLKAAESGFQSMTDKMMSSLTFRRLIGEVDNELIFQMSPENFVSLLNPMIEFFNLSDDIRGTIPTEALIIFLDDKGITPIARSIEKLLRKDGLTMISKELFTEFVHTMLEEIESSQPDNSTDNDNAEAKDDFVETDAEETETIEKESKPENEIDKPDNETIEKEITFIEKSFRNVKEDKFIDNNVDDLSEIIEEEFKEENLTQPPEIEPASSENDGRIEEEPVNEIMVSEPEQTEEEIIFEEQELKNINDLIDSKTENKIIKKLFRGETAKYYMFVNNIEKTGSWREAASIIDKEFAERKIDPYSAHAVKFREIIQNRYITS